MRFGVWDPGFGDFGVSGFEFLALGFGSGYWCWVLGFKEFGSGGLRFGVYGFSV